jgi:outer membrane receptor protein involved in Fe transport
MRRVINTRISLAFLALFLWGSAFAVADPVKTIDVPPGDLVTALDVLASQAGVECVYSAPQLKGLRTSGVHGNLTAEEAVRKLLQGTKLTVTAHKDGALLISTADPSTSRLDDLEGSAVVNHVPMMTLDRETLRLAQAAPLGPSGLEPPNFTPESRNPDFDDQGLAQIIVTASKRREEISKTGISVSAVSGEELEDRSANSLQDYLAFIPGVSLQSGGTPGYGEVSIRGIAAQSVGATTATYIDGVPFGPTSALTENALFTLDMNPTDLDHVEVLKGPQGTLYGASSMGGLIKYVTRAPDLNAFEFRATEDYNQAANGGPGAKISGAVSVPLIPGELAVRLNGYYLHEGGYITDVGVGGEDTNRDNNRGFHGSLLYSPFEALSIRLNAITQDTSVHGQDVVDVDLATGRPVYGGWTQLRYLVEPFTNSVRLYSAEIHYRVGKFDLVSATSYSSLDPYSASDITAVYQSLGLPLASPQTPIGGYSEFPSHKVTQELRLDADRMGPVEWMAGVFFQHEDDVDHVYVPQLSLPTLTPLADLDESFRSGTLTEYAGFANLTYYVVPSFDLTAGFRDSHISQTSYRGQAGLLRNPANPSEYNTSYQEFSESSDTYSFGARWRITDDILWYARAASGYRPGGGRTIPVGAPPGYADYYNADSLWDYESGIKVRALGGRLTFDADAFWINWKNIQTLQPLPGSIIVNDGNAGTAISRGAEAEVKYIPVKGLTVGANGAFTQAKFTQTVPTIAENGEPLFYVPKYTATAYGDYSHPIGGGWNGFVGADYQYTAERLDTNRTPLPAYSIWNFHVGVRDSHFRANVYVNNLTNKMAYLGYGNGGYGGPYGFAVNQPRTVGVMFSQTF